MRFIFDPSSFIAAAKKLTNDKIMTDCSALKQSRAGSDNLLELKMRKNREIVIFKS